jgi:predicted nucleic acid-binding protein
MAGYLLDTNHLGDALRRRSVVRRRLTDAHRSGARVGTCVSVLCEIDAGLAQVVTAERSYRTMQRVLSFVRIWPVEPTLAAIFGDIYLDLRGRGRVLSHVDILLAALARQMNLTLLTTDRDFEALHDLRCENWISPPPAP